MGDFPQADLYSYLTEFQPLIWKIQNAAPANGEACVPLGPGDLDAIERAKAHPFIKWLDQHEYFISARSEVEKMPYYVGEVKNTGWRENWWIQVKTVIAYLFFQRININQTDITKSILDAKRKKRIRNAIKKFLHETEGLQILEEAKDKRLRTLLGEVNNRLGNGKISHMSISEQHKQAPREFLIKMLSYYANNLTIGRFFDDNDHAANAIAFIVAIIDKPDGDIGDFQRTVRGWVNSKLVPEFQADRIEKSADAAAEIVRLFFPMNIDPCPFCGQSKPSTLIEE